MTAKLYSWNVNGLRASMDHGLMDFIESVKPDVIILGIFSGLFLGTGYLLFYRGLGVESLSSTGVTLNVQQIIVIFIGSVKPDVLCMQETKIMGNSLPVELLSAGYKLYINEAEKKGIQWHGHINEG